jgi:hypothetical protein
MHQGWPKLAANLWMATPDQGLAAVVYGPSEVATTVRGGVAVRIEEETGYPFRDTVSLIVRPERAATFPLALRIPAWATGAIVTVSGAPVNGVRTGEFLRIEREWRAGDRVELRFPMAIRVSNWYNNSIAVERGPLVYSLRVGESWHKLKQTGPASDWEIYPTSPWNYGLVVDAKNPAGAFTVKERPMAHQPFNAMDAPIEIAAKARRVPQWGLVDDSPGPLPVSPVTSRRAEESVTLVPYGAAKLRITAFPYLIPGQEAPPK